MNSGAYQSNNTFTVGAGGPYIVTVKDADGFTTTTDPINVSQPDVISVDASHTNVSCNGGNDGSVTLSGSGGTGTLQYTLGSTTNTTGEFNGLAAGSYSYSVTDANGCVPATGSVLVTQPAAIQVSVNHTDVSCNGGNNGSITLTGSGGSGALQYTLGSTMNTTGVFNNLAAGTYNYSVTDANGCSPVTGSVLITQPAATTIANAGPDQLGSSTCGITTVTLAANAATVGTGQWSIVSGGTGSFSDQFSPTSTFSGTAGNTYALRWTISNGSCGSNFDDVVVKFNQQPTTANAGPDQTACGTTTVTLAANTPLVGAGKWTKVSGVGGTFSDVTNPTSTFIGNAGNTYTLRWVISNSPCPNSRDEVVITFSPATTVANAGTDQTGSSTCGLTTVTLAGNTPTVGTGQWSVISGVGGTVANPSNPTSTFSGTAGSTYTLRWTITGACSTTFDDVVIKFNQLPTTANAGADQSVCGNSTTLAANTPSVGTGKWTKVSGSGGSFGNNTSPTSTFTGTTGVTYTLRWTITNSPCGNSTDDVVITFSPQPTKANAGADQTGSSTCNLTTVTLAGNTPTVGTGLWSIISGTGGSITNPSSPTSTFTGIAGTTYTLRWTISNTCSSNSDDVVIKFNQQPTTANAGSDQAVCGTTVTLAANTPTVGTGKWTKVSGADGSFSNTSSPTSTFTGSRGNTYILRWTISNSPCPNSSDDVIVTFNPATTTANAGPDQTGASTCGSTMVTLAANTPTVGTGQWSIISGTGGIVTNTSNPTSTFTGTAGSTYTLRWIITGTCGSSSDDVVIKFNQNPTPANAGPDQSVCGITTVTLAANAATVGTGQWSIVSGGSGTFSSSSKPNSKFTGTVGQTYVLRWTITKSPCGSSTDDVTITLSSCNNFVNTNPKFRSYDTWLKVQVLPNPSTTHFTLVMQSNSSEEVEIRVVDLYGKKVYQTRGSATEKYTFGGNLPSGLYIVQVIQGKNRQTLKVIKGEG